MYAASSKAAADKTNLSSSGDETNSGHRSPKRRIVAGNLQTSTSASKKRKAEIPLRSEFAKEWEAQVQWNKAQQQQHPTQRAMATMSEPAVKSTASYPPHPYNMAMPNQGFAGFMNQLNMYGQQQQQYMSPNYQLSNSLQQGREIRFFSVLLVCLRHDCLLSHDKRSTIQCNGSAFSRFTKQPRTEDATRPSNTLFASDALQAVSVLPTVDLPRSVCYLYDLGRLRRTEHL